MLIGLDPLITTEFIRPIYSESQGGVQISGLILSREVVKMNIFKQSLLLLTSSRCYCCRFD
ncbi:hypothetical protein C9J85_08115 [Haloferax sp. wsp5]|nr:hypothetical protein C9J85_08115 [Haloferax sp. wsp5]